MPGDDQNGHHRRGQDRQRAELGGDGQASAQAGESRRPPRAAFHHQHRAVQRQQGESGGYGINGEEVGELDLGDGESGESRRQQPCRLTVEAAGDQVDQIDGEGVGQGHEEAAHIGEARRAIGRGQGLHGLRGSADALGQRRQVVRQVGGDGQQVEREVAIGVAAAMLAVEIPEGIESGLAGIQSRAPVLGQMHRRGVEGHRRALVRVGQLAAIPVDVVKAQGGSHQQHDHQRQLSPVSL